MHKSTRHVTQVKQYNRSLILDVIRVFEPISRNDIAMRTELTPATISRITEELLFEGIILKSGEGESSGGRKPDLLMVNPNYGYVIGVDLGISKIVTVLVNLKAQIVARVVVKTAEDKTLEHILEQIFQTINTVITESLLPKEKILGIGVGAHGLVDKRRGQVLFAPAFSWHNVDFQGLIEARLGIPTRIDNDVRAMALGELWYGAGRNVNDFICINVGVGIGSGIVIGGQIYDGVTCSAGEVGHTTVDEDGIQCECGNYGCLVTVAAGPAIARAAIKGIKQGSNSLIPTLVNDLNEVDGEVVYRAALLNDPLALEILNHTGRYLGVAIANVVNILNPEKVILGGGVIGAGNLIFDQLQRVVANKALDIPKRVLEIVPAALGADAGSIGAATLVLQRIFKPAEVMLESVQNPSKISMA